MVTVKTILYTLRFQSSGFHWSLSDNKSPRYFSTLFSILVDFNAVLREVLQTLFLKWFDNDVELLPSCSIFFKFSFKAQTYSQLFSFCDLVAQPRQRCGRFYFTCPKQPIGSQISIIFYLLFIRTNSLLFIVYIICLHGRTLFTQFPGYHLAHTNFYIPFPTSGKCIYIWFDSLLLLL